MLLWLLTSPERASVSGRWAREELEDGTRLELEAGSGTGRNVKEGLTRPRWACLHQFKGRILRDSRSPLV